MFINNITIAIIDDPAYEGTSFAPRFKVRIRNEELNQDLIFGEGYTYKQAKNVHADLLKVYKAANK